MSDTPFLSIKPIITYPREAQVGKTYLMTIDLQPEEGFEWQYEEEDYPIYCSVDSNLFNTKPLGEPVIVLHRFGGSYGEAKFLLKAALEEREGIVGVAFLNRWGVLIRNIKLEGIRVGAKIDTQLLQDSYQVFREETYKNLEPIFSHIKTGETLSRKELETLIAAVRSKQITIETGERAVALGGSNSGAVIVTGDRNSVIAKVPDNVFQLLQKSISTRPRNEQILLSAIKDEVECRLDQSLYHSVSINLMKETQPEQIMHPWSMEIKIGIKPPEVIPSKMTILQVLESPEINGRLLILGKPGSGKTTTLLELAKAMLAKAEADSNSPTPVLFNLSGWRDDKQRIQDWLVTELKSKYGVSTKQGQQWIKDRCLSPLLDGLDEVAPQLQEKCVQQINVFLSGESAPLYTLVCSRIADYENHEARLRLNGAVYLRDLSDQQIQEYLERIDRTDLWHFFSQNIELLELIRTPLLLSMATIAYPQESAGEWQSLETSKDQLNYLLNAYVKRMLNREIKNYTYGRGKAPSVEQAILWLAHLAQMLEREQKVEFRVDDLPPGNRIQMLQKGLIPWNYSQFLDYCTEALLLTRTGKRYQFIHRLLQEFFASMPDL